MKFLLILLIFNSIWAQDFTSDELEMLNQGKVLIKTERLKKSDPWPEITAYGVFDMGPLSSVAFFGNYEYQKEYVPNLLESKIVKEVSPKEFHVFYEMDMPWPVPNSKYTHGHILQKENNSYKISWYLVSSDSTEEVKGSALFQVWENKTLMTYKSFVRPKSFFAGLFESTMQSDVRKTLEITIRNAKEMQNKQPLLMQKFENKITNSLSN